MESDDNLKTPQRLADQHADGRLSNHAQKLKIEPAAGALACRLNTDRLLFDQDESDAGGQHPQPQREADGAHRTGWQPLAD